MNPYDRILKAMTSQDEKDNIYITTMENSNSCYINDLKLEKDDLLIAEHLVTGWIAQDKDRNIFIEPLSKGDAVLLIKLNDTKYAIVERMV